MKHEPLDGDRSLWHQGLLVAPTPPDLHQYLRLPAGARWIEQWWLMRYADGGFSWFRRARRADGTLIRRTLAVTDA